MQSSKSFKILRPYCCNLQISFCPLIDLHVFHPTAEIICYVALGCAAIIIVVHQYGTTLMDACLWIYHEILRPFFFNTLNCFQVNIIDIAATTTSSVIVEVSTKDFSLETPIMFADSTRLKCILVLIKIYFHSIV